MMYGDRGTTVALQRYSQFIHVDVTKLEIVNLLWKTPSLISYTLEMVSFLSVHWDPTTLLLWSVHCSLMQVC